MSRAGSTSSTVWVLLLVSLLVCVLLGAVGFALVCVGVKKEIARRVEAGPQPGDALPMFSTPPAAFDEPLPVRTQGECYPFDEERSVPRYVDSRDFGSAKRFHGRVALLHVLLCAGDRVFTAADAQRVRSAIALSRRFILDQASARGVSASYDVALLHAFPGRLPPLKPDAHQILPARTTEELRNMAASAVVTEGSMARVTRHDGWAWDSLGELAALLRKRGYNDVGVIAYYKASGGRDFAYPTEGLFMREAMEIGVVFTEHRDVESLAWILTHETLHLFGAADLYRVTPRDAADDGDVMNDSCTSLSASTVGDATAFSVGWQDVPPHRAYAFGL